LPLLLFIFTSNAHYLDPRVKAFMIMTTDSGSHTVHTKVSGTQTASCKFTYQTSPTVDPVKHTDTSNAKKPISAEAVFNQLKGNCAQTTADYWTYEICFGRSVRQFRGDDSYLLGSEASMEENTQVYIKGHECTALANRPMRKTVVRLGCQETASSPRVASIQESSMCVYDLLITTDRGCGDPHYPIVHAMEQATNALLVDSGSEDWIIELIQLEDLRWMCSVYSLEMRSTGSRLSFKQFDLSISNPDTSRRGASVAGTSVSLSDFTARHPGREPCGSDEVNLSSDGHLHNLPLFNGKLSYLKMYG